MTIPILALDVSLTATGYATHITTHDGQPRARHGLITPTPKHLKGPARLHQIATLIARHTRASEARLVAIEDYAFGATSRAVTGLAELGGCIRRDLHQARIPWTVVHASHIKIYATGNGRASKNDMVHAAQQRLHWPGHDHNIADAIWLHALTSDALGQGYVDPPTDPEHLEKNRATIAAVVARLPTTPLL